jgi:hypothetical protein
MTEFEGHEYGPFDLTLEERMDFVESAAELRRYTRNLIEKNIGPNAIDVIEAFATAQTKSSWMLAWDLMGLFGEIFGKVYCSIIERLLNELENSRGILPHAVPDLASIMATMSERSPVWCPALIEPVGSARVRALPIN